MTKYLISRILRSLVSVVIVVAVVMLMIYTLLNKDLIFAADPSFTKQKNNQKVVYQMRQWEKFGYLDYVPFADYLDELEKKGELTPEQRKKVSLGRKASNDSELTKEYVTKFTQQYQSQGYTVERMNAMMATKRKVQDGGKQQLFAYKEIPVWDRLVTYFKDMFTIDNIHSVKGDVGERKLTFTWKDPAYGGQKFSPAIMGNGTQHKYLLYFDDQFPYMHQNFLTLNLGKSYSVNLDKEIFKTMTESQGNLRKTMTIYPTGATGEFADDLHTAIYAEGSREKNLVNQTYYTDDYTQVETRKTGMSKMGYSFVIGIISVILAYLLAVPLGITMALKKDTLIDKLGTLYIVFITAVPSLAYIFIFRAIGKEMDLPTDFNMQEPTTLMYVLPIVSLALPSVANLMKWLRRYMIDQMNADYVKFARSGGLSERQIFTKHVLKNAIIPIVHGIPGSILSALTGAIITERVYRVPGVGNVLTTAINAYDNGVIVGVALFYAVLTVTSVIMGDILMSMMDPRISFTTKRR